MVKANWILKSQILAVCCGLLLCSQALAGDDSAAQIQELKNGQDELRAEMQSIRVMLTKMDQQLNQIQARLTAALKKPDVAEKPKRQPDTTIYDVNIGDSPILGPKDAAVTIVEFADMQCPYCVREYPKLKKVLAAYPNDVRYVFKHFPLSFHKKAKPVHAAMVLAGKDLGNDGFWQMHDLIVEAPKKAEIADLRVHAESLGLNLAEFDKVMADEQQIDALLAKDIAEARKCKVRGTPTVLINGLKLKPRDYESYKARIDEILKAKGK